MPRSYFLQSELHHLFVGETRLLSEKKNKECALKFQMINSSVYVFNWSSPRCFQRWCRGVVAPKTGLREYDECGLIYYENSSYKPNEGPFSVMETYFSNIGSIAVITFRRAHLKFYWLSVRQIVIV